MIDHDSNPFADCGVIICYGGAKPTDRHLAATVHRADDEIIEWLERRREQRRRGVATRLACSRRSAYRYLPWVGMRKT
jgi:hypothetical protein